MASHQKFHLWLKKTTAGRLFVLPQHLGALFMDKDPIVVGTVPTQNRLPPEDYNLQ